VRTQQSSWVFAIWLWIFAGLQQGLAEKIGIAGGRPDFLIVAAVCAGLLLPLRGALIVGFLAGVIHGAIVGADQWQFILTKMIAAWLASITLEMRFQRNAVIACLDCFLATIITSVVFMFLTSQADIGGFLKATIIGAVYNGVVAFLAYLPVERTAGVTNH
jgi:cell shape-determining protein MreD